MNPVLPRTLDNSFRGPAGVVACFAIITAMTIVRSLIHILVGDGGAQSIASIPLDTYAAPAAATVVFMFAVWGLLQLLLGLVYLVVLVRYRGLIPLMLLLVAAEYAGG